MLDAFFIKKLLSVFVHLVPGVPILLLLSLLLRKWLPRFSYVTALVLCLVLVAGSFPYVSNRAVRSLENQYPVLPVAPADTGLILVNGFAHVIAQDLPINTQLYPVALTRLTEGVRLWKTKPSAKLAVSGGPQAPNTAPHAQIMYQMALELGVPEGSLVRFDATLDTEDEINTAVNWLSDNATGSRLIVVSTAMHLPRSAMLLENHDVKYSMGPTEFTISNPGWPFPSIYVLLSLDRAIHEWVGMAWYRLKALIN